MKDTALPDPIAAAHRVKDLARDLATDLTEGYRKSTRYHKMRLAVIAAWAVLSAASLWAACPSTGGPTNSLGAEVQISEELLGTQLMVRNGSGGNWTDVRLALDGGWRWETRTVRSGTQLVIATSKFTRDGAAAPSDLRPTSLVIECAQGKATASLSPRAP